MSETLAVWLTPDTYERLRGELAELRLRTLRREDGTETAESDPEDRHRRRHRIRELEDLLNRAVVGETPPDDGIAEPGMVLTVRFDDDTVTETFLLGLRDGAEQDGLDVYSPDSPLGAALLGARQGELRSYRD